MYFYELFIMCSQKIFFKLAYNTFFSKISQCNLTKKRIISKVCFFNLHSYNATWTKMALKNTFYTLIMIVLNIILLIL